jgi:hypothetical protein
MLLPGQAWSSPHACPFVGGRGRKRSRGCYTDDRSIGSTGDRERVYPHQEPAQTGPMDRRRALHDSPIDESVLEGLQALQKEGQPDFPSTIAALDLDTAPSVLKEVETAAAAGDPSLLQIALHRFIPRAL